MMSDEPQGEERRRRVRKKRRVTKVIVDGKEVSGDFLKNPSALAFPDPGRSMRKWIVALILILAVLASIFIFTKASDFLPGGSGQSEPNIPGIN